MGDCVCTGRLGTGEGDNATFSGICELSKNVLDSIFSIVVLSHVKSIVSEISLGTLSAGLTVKAR